MTGILRFGKVLNQVAAEGHIDDLAAAADSENRLVHVPEGNAERDLDTIQPDVNVPGPVPFLSEQGRVNVASAGNEQRIKFLRMIRKLVCAGDLYIVKMRESFDVVRNFFFCFRDENFHGDAPFLNTLP